MENAIRQDVVNQLVGTDATPAELAAARKMQREKGEAEARDRASETLSELQAQEAQLQQEIGRQEAELKAVRAEIRKCNTVLGNNSRSGGFGKDVKATDVVANAITAIGGAVRPRDIIGWINSNKLYDGEKTALSSTVSQTLRAMCDAGTVVKDESAKTYTLA